MLGEDGPTRRKFLARLQGEITKRGTIDVVRHGAHDLDLLYGTPSAGNPQAIGLERDDAPVFDSIIVVTDRLLLDRQIRDTIRQYAQVGATVGHAERSDDLRKFIASGKKSIISTVQKFPQILDEIGNDQRSRRFAIIIDEAHSSQGGRTSASMSAALGATGEEGEDETFEDKINRVMESRRLLPNASYFAFTATPKNKTLELFGAPEPQPDGAVRHRAFHSYTMKQAIQEGFNARIEHDRVLARIVTGMVKDDAELFKQFMDNEGFKRWMTDRVFELACEQARP